jgi:nitrogen regulatory protein PII
LIFCQLFSKEKSLGIKKEPAPGEFLLKIKIEIALADERVNQAVETRIGPSQTNMCLRRPSAHREWRR